VRAASSCDQRSPPGTVGDVASADDRRTNAIMFRDGCESTTLQADAELRMFHVAHAAL